MTENKIESMSNEVNEINKPKSKKIKKNDLSKTDVDKQKIIEPESQPLPKPRKSLLLFCTIFWGTPFF